MSKDFIFFYPGSFSNLFHKSSFRRTTAIKWEKIFLCVVVVTAIDLTVHVNREIRDHNKIPVNIDEFARELSVCLIFYYNASGNRERTVKPGCTEHATIFFYI